MERVLWETRLGKQSGKGYVIDSGQEPKTSQQNMGKRGSRISEERGGKPGEWAG